MDSMLTRLPEADLVESIENSCHKPIRPFLVILSESRTWNNPRVASIGRSLPRRQGLTILPSFLFYKSGLEVKRLSGNQLTKEDIKEAIKSVIE